MAMSVTCQVCGTANPLGRIFCGKCGSKLELGDVTHARVEKARRPSPLVPFLKVLANLAVLLLVALFVVALWPPPPLGEAADAEEARAAGDRIRALIEGLREGQSGAATFSEKEINGYLALRAKVLGIEFLGVALDPAAFRVRLSRAYGPWRVRSLAVKPVVLTFEAAGSATNGWPVVEQGGVGRLPPSRLLAPFVARRLAALFEENAGERFIWVKASAIAIRDGCAEFQFGERPESDSKGSDTTGGTPPPGDRG